MKIMIKINNLRVQVVKYMYQLSNQLNMYYFLHFNTQLNN